MSALDELYMNRRLGILNRAQDLTPSMRIDLASSALSNAELEEAVEQFNPKPQREGWGFSSVFEELLSREPRKIPVQDLKTLQGNLRNAGYLPPDHPADGVWGPDSASAFGQFDRDNADQVYQGKSLLAGTVHDGIRFFGSMLPRSVVQGVIGTAKGIVEQTPETLERSGALGGAALGAGLGTAIAPGVGTLVGAGVGAIAGLITSLLDQDDEDGNENKGLLDALHPFNEGEWTTARNFAEDVGLVASAASMVRGFGMARAGMGTLTSGTLRGSLARLDPVTKPGVIANMLGSAKSSALLGGFAGGAHQLAVGDDFGDVLEGMVAGGAAGYALGASPVGTKLRDVAAKYGLKRLNTNPVVRAVNDTFTGGVVANVGGRYAGGWGSGEHDTAIEKNIREAPTVLPEWADVIGGMVLLPNRMTPLGLGEVGQAARKLMGDTSLRPWYSALERTRDAAGNPLTKKRVREVVESLSPDQIVYQREQFGLQTLKNWVLEGTKGETPEAIAAWKASASREGDNTDAFNSVMEWYRAGGDVEQQRKNLDLVMAVSTEDEMGFIGYLSRLENQGSGIEKFPTIFAPAQERAERLALAAREGKLDYTLRGRPPVSSKDRPTMGGEGFVSEEVELQRLRDVIRDVRVNDLASTDPAKRSQGLFGVLHGMMPENEARALAKELNDLPVAERLRRLEDMVPPEAEQAAIRETRRVSTAIAEKRPPVTFVAADTRYQTAQMWNDDADTYVRLVEQARRANAEADAVAGDVERAAQAVAARARAQVAGEELQTFLASFRDPTNHHRQLEESILDLAFNRNTKKHYKVVSGKRTLDKETYLFADHLKDRAKHAATDVDLADPTLAREVTDNGYKLVATGENVRLLSEVRELAQANHVGNYTKRAALIEAAGMSPFAVTEREIGQIKQADMDGMLNEAAVKLGISLPGGDARRRLVNKMEELNNRGLNIGPVIKDDGKIRLFKVDLRQLKLEDIVDALGLDSGVLTMADDPMKAAQVYKDFIHRGQAFGSDVLLGPRHWADDARQLASAMRIEGLTGFSDFMRQFHITNPARALTVAGGVGGAAIGAQEEGLEGAVKGGIAGTLALGSAAYGGKAFLKKWPNKSPFKPNTYGWLPNHLHNAAMAMRYSLSFTFDIGRRMEQGQIASMRHGLPVVFAPTRWAKRHLVDDFGGNVDAVMPGLRTQLDEVMGSRMAMSADDVDRRSAAIGMTGFNQRDADAVYAHLLLKRGNFNQKQLREEIYKLGHYGSRTGFERSLNFVIFPFSFSKKMLTTMGDFMLAEPARALLVHEGMRQWYQTREGGSMSEKFAEYSEKYFPLAEQIARFNNLSYGLSPGRFFLEGMTNNKTLLGKVGASLAAVFTPSGATTPLQRAAGKAGDQMVNLFTPIFLTGEDTDNFAQIFEDFAPAVRDVRNLALGQGGNQGVLSEQFTALTDRDAIQLGGGGAPWHQVRSYNNERRAIKNEYADLAVAFGYSSVDGFLNSEMGIPYKAETEARIIELGSKYPTGLEKSTQIETSASINDKAKAELLADPNPSPSEAMIGQLIEMQLESEVMADMLGLTSEEVMMGLAQQIRQVSTQWSDDARFRELYKRFFEYEFGPISRTYVARVA